MRFVNSATVALAALWFTVAESMRPPAPPAFEGSLDSKTRRSPFVGDRGLLLPNCRWGSILCSDMSKCVRRDQICDTEFDCEDGSDEMRCTPPNPKLHCFRIGYFACANRQCVNPLDRCDGEDDCGDNSDEIGC